MKIIEGKFAGTQIQYKEQKGTRISSEKVRKAVFDVLKNITNLSGLKAVDLFCGTGMYGLEALSRGAVSVYFVDDNKKVIEQLKKNIIKIFDDFEDYCEVLSIGFEKFVKSSGERFDLVFAAPPYYNFDFNKFNEIYKILEKDGIFVLEYSSRMDIGDFLNLRKISDKTYGDAKVTIFQRT